MKHLEKDRCGWKNYRCVGIKDLFSDSISICCDVTNYDIASDKRQNDYNYLNLPTAFQGVVNIVPFANLQSLSATSAGCISSYDPMQDGLQDWFAKVSGVGDYVSVYGDFKAHLACYFDRAKQTPGIMTPKAQLSPFNVAPSVVVPTSQLRVDPVKIDLTAISSWDGKSACANGFAIIPLDHSGSGYRLYVSSGDVIPSVDANGQAVSYYVSGDYPQSSSKRYKTDVQVYLTAKYDFTDQKWQFRFAVVQQGQDWDIDVKRQQWEKVTLLGTVNCVRNGNSKVQTYVTQTACSPVDMRDFVSQVPMPSGTDTSMYVFAYLGSSKIKKWVQVKDC